MRTFTIEELQKGTNNPFYEKLNKEVTVAVRYEDYEVFADTARQNGEKVTPEDVMRRCLADYAEVLRTHE